MRDGRNGLAIGLSLIWYMTLLFCVTADFEVMLYAAMASALVTGFNNLRATSFLGDNGT